MEKTMTKHDLIVEAARLLFQVTHWDGYASAKLIASRPDINISDVSMVQRIAEAAIFQDQK
jgi:hypothetical protein